MNKNSKTVRYFGEGKSAKKASNETGDNDKPNRRNKKKSKVIKDAFVGTYKVPEERKLIYKRGEKNEIQEVRHEGLKHQIKTTESKYEFAITQAARSELLLTESAGFLEGEKGEETYEIPQNAIVDSVDITSASKRFQLDLEHGPYRIDYTRNGRHLLLGGNRGHVAAFDWVSKKLMCEVNVMEAVNDVKWLHTENMYAVAQNKWTYVYDNTGTEIHCLKKLNDTLQLDYLPFHFLLVTSSRHSYLQYLDISVGKIVSKIRCKMGALPVMTHNPHNAVELLGHALGTVTMWTPSCKEPVVKMLCHRGPVRGIAVDRSGTYLATCGQDHRVKIFDVRTYKPLHAYHVPHGPTHLSFSDKGMLAISSQNNVVVYKDPCVQLQEKPYMRHEAQSRLTSVKFCPYEDVLGLGKYDGIESILIPGSAEANYDTFEANPYRNNAQRREWEVKALLEKIDPDMITLDPMQLGKVNAKAVTERQEQREKLFGKPVEPTFTPRYRKKGKSKSGNIEKRKQMVHDLEVRRKLKKTKMENRKKMLRQNQEDLGTQSNALSRFKKK